MAGESMVAALDIGTSKIVCIIGERDSCGGIFVIGHGHAPVDGLKRGMVVDMDKTVKSIRKAIDDAQLVSGTEIDRVTVGIAGEHIRSIDSHGVVAIGRSDHEITSLDMTRAIEAARTIAIPVDREIIHVIPQDYSVDDQTNIKDPVGMSGVRLEVQAHIVTASVTSAKNIFRALERSRLGIDHMVLESLALSEFVLTERETETGSVSVDIGGEITDVSLFYDNAIRHTAVIPVGGRHVTNDIAIGLKMTIDQAEELKIAHGAALASLVDPADMIHIPGIAGRSMRELSRNVLASICEPRMEEILALVGREIKKEARNKSLTGGLVLTGGGSLLPGTLELAEQMFSMPVRRGVIRGIEHTPDELNSVRYATVHALMQYGFKHEAKDQHRGSMKSWIRKMENWITKQF
ncbi:MAG: cell division protein FtsA [candidate division Zixibacteria bacterium]|nr:cell division protein FtsA [candidate division Zixibacteria bacterium]